MKLQLQINSKAIKDDSRALAPTGIMVTPAIDENFWLYRVPVSDEQAIIGFPKFSVIGIGFQHEKDWNTNLPSGGEAQEIYDHIKHNKGDAKIPRARCIDAIRLIQRAVLESYRKEAISKLSNPELTYIDILRELSSYLRKTGSWEVAEAWDRRPEYR